MDIKKAIEEEREEFIKHINDKSLNYNDIDKVIAINSFDWCAELWEESTRWRKVEEELPEIRENGTSDYVLVKVPYESYHVAQYCKNPFYPNGAWFDPYVELSINVTHWKPIH